MMASPMVLPVYLKQPGSPAPSPLPEVPSESSENGGSVFSSVSPACAALLNRVCEDCE